MAPPRIPTRLSTRVLLYEATSFVVLAAFLWADEVADLPSRVLGLPATPINWAESSLETGLVCVCAAVCIYLTHRVLTHAHRLEGLLPICASCKKIRDAAGDWSTVEMYLSQRADVDFTHGICPECCERLYGSACKRIADKRS